MGSISGWLSELNDAVLRKDVSGTLKLFHEEECFWRDFLVFTWSIHTCESKNEIAAMLEETLERAEPSGWKIDGPAIETDGVLEAEIQFQTPLAKCRGYVKLKEGKCWVLVTTLWELKGHEEQAGPFRPQGVLYGPIRGRRTWLQKREQEEQELGRSKQPYCVIVGGGQAGIALGARLKALGVPTIILEKNEKPGDTWRNRYSALNTHTPVYSDHMPYMNFPSTWPLFSSKDEMGDFFECYVKLMRLDYWCSSECKSASFDEDQGCWNVSVENRKTSTSITLHPVHLILATGSSGFANVPRLEEPTHFTECSFTAPSFAAGKAGKVSSASSLGHVSLHTTYPKICGSKEQPR